MSSTPAKNQPVPTPGPKTYSAPGLPYHQRPLPPGWISQYDANQQADFYIDEHTNPPTITWDDPRPAYYMALDRAQNAPPPPGMQQGRQRHHQSPQLQPQMQQPQVQQQQVHTVQNSDGSITTITSNGQPIVIQAAPQQQQQVPQQQFQQQSSGPSLGRTLVGAAVVSSLLRPRATIVAPRRRRF